MRFARGEGKILGLSNFKTMLTNKLEREFEQSNKDVLLEDIKAFLLINEWSDASIQNLLERENVLHDLLFSLLNDDEFNHLFEIKISAFVKTQTSFW